ncbi:DUF4136 domain-containing protein [Tenacibaculum sp. AHE15PA]|uniref:DUF4136 domain-containing protein n=1 Tax=Tenacibaculum TaxID=104267 RepID=UPI001C4EF883|nr:MULTISPECIES: DUF4136 domain-containing protein [Tenacibaculum]QXP72508.1 DUF4136 domain-containing protein [Tenacibaculum sp. AHE14PA]QXP76423.1 DUF4136 domain-containing protein [Tenacibaculum sp. AHE15PA]
MRPLKYLFLIFIVGCSSTNVVYDYDSKTDFKAYKTFNFFEDAGEGLNELDVKRITNELTSGLQQKGMKLSEDPDMYINILSKESKKIDRSTIGIGMGGGRNVGFGISGGIPIGSKKINQRLIIDFVKSENDELLWQGISNGAIKERTTPEERLIHYKKIIEKMLMNYPPKK